MRVRALSAVLVVFAVVPAFGIVQSETVVRSLPIDPAGTVWVSNAYGSVDVIGSDDAQVTVSATRTINAMDQQTLAALRDAIAVTFEGDARTRLVKSVFPPRDRRWNAIINVTVRVPRSVNVKVAGHAMDHVRVTQVSGSVTINTFSGTIILSNVAGEALVDTVNGRVIFDYPERPAASARVQAVNADVDVYAPRDASFAWVAETLTGQLLTTFDVKGLFNGNVYRGRANGGSGGPTFTISSLAGKVSLLAKGTPPSQARPITAGPAQDNAAPPRLPAARKVQIPFVYQNWVFESNVADVTVGEIHAAARIFTGAGEVEIGSVWGNLVVKSGGGPLRFGDLFAPVDLHTDAGDVTVRYARQGGSASTDGGIVRIMYAGGPMTLRSGGGDIIVQQTVAPIDAVTSSGDISITVGPTIKTQRLTAKTSQGNVSLVLNPNFGADIDALLITDSEANSIQSDFNLTFRREESGGKTRIHATGKINGGGERVELVAEDGSINISSQVIMPINPPMQRR